jgi:hypothetical protein
MGWRLGSRITFRVIGVSCFWASGRKEWVGGSVENGEGDCSFLKVLSVIFTVQAGANHQI